MCAPHAFVVRCLTLFMLCARNGAALVGTTRAADDAPAAAAGATDEAQPQQIDAQTLIKEGQEVLKSGDYQKALDAFDKLVPGFERMAASGGDKSQQAAQALPTLYVLHAQAIDGRSRFRRGRGRVQEGPRSGRQVCSGSVGSRQDAARSGRQ